jgi:CheY-like chemotaxis protein
VTTEPATGRVLVIDDEPLVLRALTRSLKKYYVVAAPGGEVALEVLASDPAFDVIICDLMMPKVDGPSMFEAIRTRWPGLERRMMFCSGGAATPRAREFLASITNPHLAKPIRPSELAAAVARMMSSTETR